VGGVIGGLAVIALAVVAFALLRRRKQPPPVQPVAGVSQIVPDHYPSPVPTYDTKHTSYYQSETASPQHSTLASPFEMPAYHQSTGHN
jgi:hypothetical protein